MRLKISYSSAERAESVDYGCDILLFCEVRGLEDVDLVHAVLQQSLVESGRDCC